MRSAIGYGLMLLIVGVVAAWFAHTVGAAVADSLNSSANVIQQATEHR